MSSFLPAHKNFPFWKNTTFRYLFEWLDDNGTSVKPHNLTGYTATCLLTPVRGQPGVPLELTTGNGGVIFGGYVLKQPTNGFVELYITKAQLEAVAWKKANYTLVVTEGITPFDVFSLLTGRFTQAGP